MAISVCPEDVSCLAPCMSEERALTLQQVLRDMRERGRDVEGCIKQWFTFVKPNFHKYVEPQRAIAGTFILSCKKPSMMNRIINA